MSLMVKDIFKKIETLGNRRWDAFLLCVLPFLILSFPLLAGRTVFAGQDTWAYAHFHFIREAIFSGDSILWNPHIYSGFPSFASFSGGYLSPVTHIFLRLVSSALAVNWLNFFNLVFSSFFTFLFLKNIRVSFWPALASGIVYGFSQWQMNWEVGISNALFITPVLFYAVWGMRRCQMRYCFLYAFAFWYGILAVHVQYVLYSALTSLLFAVFLLFLDEQNNTLFFRNWKQNRSFIIFYILACVLAAAASLYQIIPTMIYISLSSERAAMPHWQAAEGGILWGDTIKSFFPYFNIWLIPSSYDTFYVGVFPLIFLFFSYFWTKKNAYARFFLVLFVGSVLFSLNGSWLFWALHHIFPFNLFHFPFRGMFIGWFAASALFGLGLEMARRGEALRYARAVAVFLKYAFLSFFLASLATKIFLFFYRGSILFYLKEYFRTRIYPKTTGLPIEHYYGYIDRTFFQLERIIDLFNPQFIFSLLFIGVAAFLLQRFYKGRIEKDIFVTLVSIVAILNMFFVWARYEQTFAMKIFERVPDTARFLKEYGMEGRTLSVLKSFTEFQKITAASGDRKIPPYANFMFNSEMAFANTNVLFGIDSSEMYDGLTTRRMNPVMGHLGSNLVWSGDNLANFVLPPMEKIKILEGRRNVLNFIGVRYLVSSYPFDNIKFPKIFETVILPPYNIPIAIYENKEARPRFYFADSVETIHENEEAAFEKLKTIPEKGLGVFIECPAVAKSQFQNPKSQTNSKFKIQNSELNFCEGSLLVDGQGEIEVKTKKNTLSILKTSSETPQFLVFSENNLPGWKAYVDGVETPIYTVGSVYMGVVVSEGEHEIKFEFTYRTIVEEFIEMMKNRLGYSD